MPHLIFINQLIIIDAMHLVAAEWCTANNMFVNWNFRIIENSNFVSNGLWYEWKRARLASGCECEYIRTFQRLMSLDIICTLKAWMTMQKSMLVPFIQLLFILSISFLCFVVSSLTNRWKHITPFFWYPFLLCFFLNTVIAFFFIYLKITTKTSKHRKKKQQK